MCFYKNEQVAVSIKTPLGEDHDKVIEKNGHLPKTEQKYWQAAVTHVFTPPLLNPVPEHKSWHLCVLL